MTMKPDLEQAVEIAAGLTDMERELLLGESTGWGSWMFMVGSDLCAKGLGRKSDGSIYLDTPLADAVCTILEKGNDRGE